MLTEPVNTQAPSTLYKTMLVNLQMLMTVGDR